MTAFMNFLSDGAFPGALPSGECEPSVTLAWAPSGNCSCGSVEADTPAPFVGYLRNQVGTAMDFPIQHGAGVAPGPQDSIYSSLFPWGGAVPCVPCTSARSRTLQKSNARSCRGLHVCATRRSEGPARASGLTRRLKRWLRWLAVRFERPPMKSPANENHPPGPSRRLSTNAPSARKRPF